MEGGLKAFFDESFAQTLNRAGMDLESLPDLFIGPAVSLRSLVRLEKNPRMPLLESCRFPFGDGTVQTGALLRGERDEVSLLGNAPCSFPNKGDQEKEYGRSTQMYRSLFRNATLMDH